MSLVISLSSIPSRFSGLRPVLESIARQTAEVDEIRLYIPRKFRRFPDYDGSLPEVPRNVRIIRPNEDLGPGSKVLFAADDLKGTDCDIIYCDDDMIYEADRFARIIQERNGRLDHCVSTDFGPAHFLGGQILPTRQPVARMPPKTLSYRMRRGVQILRETVTRRKGKKPFRFRVGQAGYTCIAKGFGGVLVRPEFFDDLFYDIPPVLWTVDDYWLSGHMERKGIPIWTGAEFRIPPEADSHAVTALFNSVVDGANRTQANDACVRYMQKTYGIWQ